MTDDELKDFLIRVYEHVLHSNESAAMNLLGDLLEEMGVNLDYLI